jgi:hypothetical protein
MLKDELDLMAERLTGLPAEVAYRLCIIKYLTRINVTTNLERDERYVIEAEMAIRFLKEPDVTVAIIEFRQEKIRAEEEENRARQARADAIPADDPLLRRSIEAIQGIKAARNQSRTS